MKVCIAVLCIGDEYLKMYNDKFRRIQEFYATKHGYDFRVLTDFLDKKYNHKTTCSMHTLLICDQDWARDYDYIICIDGDIIINKNAPPIHEAYDFGDKIGLINQSQPTLEARHKVQRYKGFEVTAKDYYKLKSNHDIDTDHIINTGVMVWQPKKHAKFLKDIFYKYVENQIDNPAGLHYEQSVIGYEIQKNNLHYYMGHKWNALWGVQKCYYNQIDKTKLSLGKFYKDNYFTHLAGGEDHHLISN